jgi:hypothetical protein
MARGLAAAVRVRLPDGSLRGRVVHITTLGTDHRYPAWLAGGDYTVAVGEKSIVGLAGPMVRVPA